MRARGFSLPAAGKTGTSHDGWFAGFTSNLLAVVWVGYDDDRELNITGAHSALPIWTEFMKRAVKLPAYKDVQEFTPPSGIVTAHYRHEYESRRFPGARHRLVPKSSSRERNLLPRPRPFPGNLEQSHRSLPGFPKS